MRGGALDLLGSYLEERAQYMVYEGHKSGRGKIGVESHRTQFLALYSL